MRIKDGIIQCAPAYMVQLLGIITEDSSDSQFKVPNWDHLMQEGQSYPQPNIHKFKCGAQLGRSGESRWYASGTKEAVRMAHYELQAADHMRQARGFNSVVEEVRRNTRGTQW